MKRWGKRILSLFLAVVMTAMMLPTTAFAALMENQREQNEAILSYLRSALGENLTQEQADSVLAQLEDYGLLDEDGNIITDWVGKITIQDDPQPLNFREALELKSGTVTVNTRLCDAGDLRDVLVTLEELGLLADGSVIPDWQLAVNGNAVIPVSGLAAAIEAAQAPDVTVLGGTPADADALLSVIDFLAEYGLLTDTGAAADWDMTLPGESREISREELEALLAEGTIDESAVVAVDGTEITVGNLMTILDIETELQRIQETYFRDEVELTNEQAEALLSLYNQLLEGGGFTLYNTSNADALTAGDFPSGVNQTVTISAQGAWENGEAKLGSTYTVTVTLNKEQAVPVTFSWQVFSGSVEAIPQIVGEGTIGSGMIPAGQLSTSFTVLVDDAAGFLASGSQGVFIVQIYDVENALFQNTDGTKQDSWTEVVRVAGENDERFYAETTTNTASYSGVSVFFNETNSSSLRESESGALYDLFGVKSTDDFPIDIYLDYLSNEARKIIDETVTFSNMAKGTYEITFATLGQGIALQTPSYDWADSFWEQCSPPDAEYTEEKNVPAIFHLSADGVDEIDLNGENAVEIGEKEKGVIVGTYGTDDIVYKQEYVKIGPEATNVATWPYDISSNGTTVSVPVSLTVEPMGFWSHVNNSLPGMPGSRILAFVPDVSNLQLSVSMSETHTSTTATVSAPSGTFQSGQVIPITVEFGFPMVIHSSMAINVANNAPLHPVEANGTVSDHVTFLYTVPETGDRNLTLIAQNVDGEGANGANGRVVAVSDAAILNSSGSTIALNTPDNINSATVLDIPRLTDAMGDWTANVTEFTYHEDTIVPENSRTYAVVDLTMEMPEDATLRGLLLGENYSYAYDGETATYCGTVALSLDGGQTLIPVRANEGTGGEVTSLSAQLELDVTDIDPDVLAETMSFVAELYEITVAQQEGAPPAITSDGLLYGHYVAYAVKPPVPLTADDITVTKVGDAWNETELFVDAQPKLTLQATLENDKEYTWSQVAWYTDNENIARVTADPSDPLAANVTLYSTGTVNIYVRAVNGNVEAYRDNDLYPFGEDPENSPVFPTDDNPGTYIKMVASLVVGEGDAPYLLIPGDSITVRAGEDVPVRWASNLVQKNAEYADNAITTFTIEVYEGGSTTGTPIQTRTVTYDPNDKTDSALWVDGSPNLTCVLSGLDTTSAAGEVSYTVKVSAAAADGVPGVDAEAAPDRVFSATVPVTVLSRPVSVKLNRPDSFYVTNSGTLSLGYTLTDYDAGNDAEFELAVTNNATGEVVYRSSVPDSANGGSFTLDLSEAAITDNFRTIYDVSLKAKNTAEPDWSRDSFTLYIYDRNALQIVVEEIVRDGQTTVDVNGDTVTMSNEDWIASLTQNQILALNRDIDLQTGLSINYNDHPWGEASDRVTWSSGDSDVVAVNYPQGSYYENIEGLPYVSYAPATEFLLSGKDDGTTVVQAIHALAGEELSDEVKVTVETLKDKLYLFQFYPAAPNLTMTYTNGNGAVQTKTSDSNGRFAVYEASGIASDVYVEGTIDGEKYLGTVYQEDLVSQEKDAVSLELYPLNSLTLRKAASLPVYLKTPDGKPFSGTVQVRAGVYRNDEWCQEAYVDTKNGKNTGEKGKTEDYQVSFTNGAYTFEYDLTQFSSASQDAQGDAPVTAADDIQFVLELRAEGTDGTTYYPILFSVYGSLNEEDAVRLAQRVVNLEKVPEGQENKPFIVRQALYYTGEEQGLGTDIRNKSGRVGPSATYPDTFLATTVFWWGEENEDPNVKDNRTIRFTDSTGTVLEGQTTVGQEQYPFCSMPVSHNTVPLDEDQLNHLGIGEGLGSRYLELRYIDGAGATVKRETMPWKFVNALDLTDATSEDSGLLDKIGALHELISGNGSEGVSVGNDFLTLGIVMATDMGISVPGITMTLAPTSDPTTFRGLVSIGANNVEDDNVVGIDADTDRGADLDAMPDLDTIKGVLNNGLGQTFTDQTRTVDYARGILERTVRAGGLQRSPLLGERQVYYALQGWFEIEVTYDYDEQGWDFTLLTGGFNAGGGMGYEWTWNFQVGPVPLVFQLEAGASGVLAFTSLKNPTYGGEDYLTELRLYAYLQAFGGIGFDYAVIALKLGLYGRIGLEASLKWLNSANDNIGNVNGQYLNITGEIGAKFQVELLFISYQKILWSQDFTLADLTYGKYKEIGNYWDHALTEAGNSEKFFQPDPGTNSLPRANLLMMDGNGTALYAADLEASLLDRDYLDNYQRTYDASGPSVDTGSGSVGPFRAALNAVNDLFSGGDSANNNGDTDTSDTVETLENSYTQANPVLTDDGEYMFYLSDKNDTGDATAVRVAFMKKNGNGGYSSDAQSGDMLISDSGFGDSGVSASGSGDDEVAVAWSRVTEEPYVTEPGQAVTPDIQAHMIAASDVFVAVPDGSGWTVKNLTEGNHVGDLSPVVARQGNNILVAWRQVASSDASDVSNFNARDYIYYAASNDGGENWSQPRPLYNGTSGSVKGIEAAMLTNGTAAVAFTLEGEEELVQGVNAQSVAYAVIDLAQVSQDTTGGYDPRYVVMEDDGELAENPQLATVTLDGQEVFVLGWHSTAFTAAGSSSDIRLAAIDSSGNRVTGFVDALSSLIENTGVSVSADFQFVQNADSLDQLSILWSDTAGVSGSSTDAAEDSTSEAPAHDVINGLRFRTVTENGVNKVSVTAAQQIVEMPDWTTVDSFTAYVDGDAVYAVTQGTYYDYTNTETVTVELDNGTERIVSIANEKTSIYTSAGVYTDTIRVDSVIPDYANIRKGASVPVQIGITNLGTQPLSQVTVTIGNNDPATFGTGNDAFVPIAPGQSRTLTVYYTIPSDQIPNPQYTIAGTFETGSAPISAVEDALLVLNVPDLGIADTDILVAAEDGYRTLQFTLFNNSDAELAGSGRSVKLGIYSDATRTNPISEQYISEYAESGSTAATTRDGNSDAVFTIDSADLAQIDEGSYTVQYRFNLADYIAQNTGTEMEPERPFADENGEVRDAGVTLYAKVWVEDEEPGGTTGELQEFITSNNSASIKLESLLKQADGEPVTITTRLSRPADGGTQVDVTLRNNSIAEERTGSVIVTLLDQAGGVLEQKKVSVADGAGSDGSGVVTLGIEQTLTLPTITFTTSGASVLVSYLDPVNEPGNADLKSLSFSNITGVSLADSFQPDPNDPNTLRASVSVLELTSSAVVAVAKNENATITVTNDATDYRATGTGIFGETVPLTPGQTNTITIQVTLADGSATKTYILTVQNDERPGEDDERPGEDDERPGEDDERPGHDDERPGQDDERPGQDDERPGTGQSSGSSSSSRYSVHVEDGIAHGSVTVSPQQAQSGQTVTITTAPDQGWQVGSVTVTTADGREIAVKQTGENTYTFTMPNSAVYVDVRFVEAGTAWVNPFTDVAEGTWYYDAVQYVYENGLMSGTSSTTFAPDLTTTRSQIVTILWRLSGSPSVDYLMNFDDVAEGTWYTEAVRWAVSTGVASGYGNGTFGPDDPITREQLAVMLYRYTQIQGYAITQDGMAIREYSDYDQVSGFALEAMDWALSAGIINGTGGNMLSPQGTATRAQAAVMLMRFCEQSDIIP